MAQQVALVTGGNRGLGLATAQRLASRGLHVVLTARKPAEGEAAMAKIRALTPDAKLSCVQLDLASFASVRACAEAFRALGLPLNLLINNAGLMAENPKPAFTVEGFEYTLGANHLGHFLLTHLLLKELERAAPSRLVVLSSAMHRKGVGPGPGPDFDYDNLKAEKSFHPTTAYRNSKLANLWFAQELQRRMQGKQVTVLAVSPGWVPETLAETRTSGFQRFLFKHVLPKLPIASSVAQASGNTAWAATEPGLESQGGGYFEKQMPGVVSDDAKDPAQAARCWEMSCKWCGIETFGAP